MDNKQRRPDAGNEFFARAFGVIIGGVAKAVHRRHHGLVIIADTGNGAQLRRAAGNPRAHKTVRLAEFGHQIAAINPVARPIDDAQRPAEIQGRRDHQPGPDLVKHGAGLTKQFEDDIGAQGKANQVKPLPSDLAGQSPDDIFDIRRQTGVIMGLAILGRSGRAAHIEAQDPVAAFEKEAGRKSHIGAVDLAAKSVKHDD